MPPEDNQLESLARERFPVPPLTAAELELLRAIQAGNLAVCGPNDDDKDPANDPSKADADWKVDRTIRADLIRWLCVDRQVRELVGPQGILAYGAKVTGPFDLSYAAVPFRLALRRCRFAGETILRDLEIAQLDFQGSWLDSIAADGARVKGDVFLRDGFHAA